MRLRIILFIFFIVSLTKVFPQSYEDARVVKPVVSPALKLTENIGQWDNKILFKAQLDGGNLFLERNCLTFNFYDKQKIRAIHHGGFEKGIYKDYSIKCHAYKVNFLGCNLNSQIEKYQKGSDYENFYLGNNPRKWKSNVNNYHQVWLKNLYNGIDYEVITSVNGLKYNFHLQPNSNVNDIKLQYDGADKVKIKDGALIVKLQINTIIEQKPFAYQLINGFIKQIPCNYKLNDNVLSFDFPEGYDKNYSLVIDPVLVFAAQAGSTADNFGMTATFDQQGNFYSGGTVFDIGYPFVTGSYSNFFNGPPAYGNTDIFLTKYNSTGNALLFSTYMGGNGTEVVTSLIVDKTNNLYLYGATGSANFPVLATGAYTTFAGGSNIGFISNGSVFFNGTDMYIAKFNSSGTTLLGSTYYGGSGNDGVNYLEGVNTTTFNLYPAPGTATTNITNYDSLQTNYGDTYRGEIQLDTLNNVYIASSTRSSDLPIVGGFDNTLGGKQDAVIAKFNTGLTSLIYSSFIGGPKMECGNGLFVTPNFEVFVTGGTTSNTLFPSMAGGQSPTYNGGKCDGFLCKINASGNSLLQSTYIGTNLYDNSFCVQCNVAGEPHVFGQSKGNMPVIIPAGASSIYSVTNTHQFITKYNNTLTTKLMSTVFGSSTSNFDISPSAFAVDECNGNIYLSGWGGNILTGPPISGMPLLNPTQATTTGYDFYLMALKPNASSLLYGSYFGGSNSQEHVDGGTSRFDRKGVIYQSVCAGCGGNQDFPHTAGAWPCPTTTNCPNPNPSGNCNNGVFKIDFQLQTTIASINTNTVAGCAPLTVNLTNSMPGTSYTWYLGPGNTTSTVPNPAITFTNPGTYTISLVVNDTTKCIKKDSAIKIITVYQKSTPAFTSTITPCSNSLTATNTSTGSGSTYTWNFGDASPTTTLSNPTHTYAASGNYTITLVETNSFGCKDSIKKPVTALIFNPVVVNSSTMCSGYTTTLTANGGTSYSWTPTSSLSNPSSASTVANPTTTTIYTVIINNNSTGDNCTSTLTTQITVFPKPSASFSTSMNPCGGGVNFTDQSASNIVAWQWNLSSSITSTVQNPYNFYSTGGTHTINLIVTNNDGCKDTSQQIITVIVPPPLSINGNSLICAGNKAQLNASGGVSYQWTPTLSLDISSIATPVASPTISTTYSVIITTSGNCSFLLNTTVNVSQIPTGVVSAIASPPYIITGNSTTLTYLGAPGSVITWYPLGSTSPATGYTVSASPIKPTTYTAVANTGACTQKTKVFVEAYSEGCIDKDVFVPNTFTPNADGQNDIFIVRGLKVQEIYFAIYNRWGELVFETTDKTTGWDGIYKGRPADVGVFGWYLKVKCFNGEETFRKGNVTLVR